MDLTPLLLAKYAAALIVGVVAGGVNTLAGNGSAITLPMLIFLDLPANYANATNRVGVLLASLVGARTFHRGGVLETRAIGWLIVPAMIGAAVGAYAASQAGQVTMYWVIASVLVFMLLLLVTQPNRWIREEGEAETNHRKISTVLCLFGIGLYGGFIQAGVGILLLAALVLRAKMTLVKANAIKVVLVFCFTLPVLAVFVYHDQVIWSVGLLMAVGQCTGAWLAARYAAHHPQANVWIRRLLVVMIVVVLIKMLLVGLSGEGTT